jgi:pilus assembly protein CpaF
MDISECEILPNGERAYHTLFRFHITKNEIVDSEFVTEGKFEQPEIMSENLKKKLLQFGVPQEELNKFLKKGADYK